MQRWPRTFLAVAVAALAVSVPAATSAGSAPPLVAVVITANGLSSTHLTVAVGGKVLWANATQSPHTIAAAGGRFAGFTLPAFGRHTTVFPQAGTYPYRLDGSETGTIVVSNAAGGGGSGRGGSGGGGGHVNSRGGFQRCCFVLRLFAGYQIVGDFPSSVGDFPTGEEVHVQWEGLALLSYSDTGPKSRPRLALVPGATPRVGAWFMEQLLMSESAGCSRSWSTSGTPSSSTAFVPQPRLFAFGQATIAANAGPPFNRRFVDCGYDGTADTADSWDSIPPPWHGTFAYPSVALFRHATYIGVKGPSGSVNGTITGHGGPHHAVGGGSLSLQFFYVPGGSNAQRAAAVSNFDKKYPATSSGFLPIP